MKKIFTILIALVLAFSMSVAVFAEVENFAKDTKWTTGHSGGVSQKDGAYKATGIKAAYCSPFINIYPAVKAALGTDTDAELVIKFKIRADFTNGNEGEVSSARSLIRGGNLKKEEIDGWNAAYEEALDGETFFKADGGGNIMCYLGSGFTFTDDEWTTVIIEFSVTDVIVNCDMVSEWNFCIDSISNSAIIDALYFKDFVLAQWDDSLFEDTDPEPVEGANKKPEKEEKPDSNEPVSDENFAANLTWSGINGASVTVGDDGVVTATNFKYPYSAPAIDVLPSIKKALGDDDSLEVYIVFDARVVYTAERTDESVTASTLFRGNSTLGVKTSEVDEWKEAYADSFDDAEPLFTNSQGNVMKYLGHGIAFSEEWKTEVIALEFEAEQITNPSISKWTFCIDNISNNALIDKIEIKNFRITLEEPEIEGAEDTEDTEKPATDAKPNENANKPDPNATPTPYVVWATPIGYKPADNGNAGNGNNGGSNGGNYLGIIIAAAAVVVVGAGAVGALVVLKKKKKNDQ